LFPTGTAGLLQSVQMTFVRIVYPEISQKAFIGLFPPGKFLKLLMPVNSLILKNTLMDKGIDQGSVGHLADMLPEEE